MKRRLVIFVFSCFFSLTGLQAKVIPVCNSCEVRSVKAGVRLASDFDTLLIQKGKYKEFNILIDKPLTLLGKGYPEIDGEDKGEVLTVTADHVVIDGLFIVNVGTSYTRDYAAIRVVKSEYFEIRNTILEKLFFGIYLEKAQNGKIVDNRITGDAVEEFNSGNGIHLWYCKNVEVTGNTVQKVRDGIYLEFSDKISILNNISSGNVRYGLHFMFSNDDLYTNNVFRNNGAGVAVMFSKRIKMQGNTFLKNWGPTSYGLLLKEINDAEIDGNTFEENTTAIALEGSNRITYQNNHFIKNGWALKVRGACYANLFTQNNFLHNSFDVSYDGKLNDNRFTRNYWSNYTGYDLDKDGYGDVPYRPVKLFSYIVNRTPETIVLLRSLFMDLIDFSEKVSPVFTPDNLADQQPLMRQLR